MERSMPTDSKDKVEPSRERASPRAIAELDVDVEVAGEKRRVKLVSKDIGAGGMFLRTDEPAPLWKRVKLAISLPDGKNFEVGGEVVRSIPKDRASEKQSPGMAVAFDEVSRTRHKMLLQLVLDLCSQRPSPAAPSATPARPQSPATPPAAPPAADQNDPDALLSEIDELLGSMEAEIKSKKTPAPPPRSVSSSKASPSPPQPSQPSRPAPPPSAPAEKKAAPATPRPAQLPPRPAGGDLVATLRADLAAYRPSAESDDYYAVLEISRTASAEQIQSAYQRLLDRFKPACPPEALPRELMKQLSEVLGRIRKAYAILSHPDRRKAYDFLLK